MKQDRRMQTKCQKKTTVTSTDGSDAVMESSDDGHHSLSGCIIMLTFIGYSVNMLCFPSPVFYHSLMTVTL